MWDSSTTTDGLSEVIQIVIPLIPVVIAVQSCCRVRRDGNGE